MSAAQQLSRADECPRGKVLAEISAIDAIEFIVECQIGTVNSDSGDIIHRHSCLTKRSFESIEQEAYLLLDVRRDVVGLRIGAETSGKIECIAHEHTIAKW